MKLKKSRKQSLPDKIVSGKPEVLTGVAAVRKAASLSGAFLGVHHQALSAVGKAIAGSRAAVLLDGNDSKTVNEVYDAIVDKKIPLVLHLTVGITGDGHAAQTGYEILHTLSRAGIPQFSASTVQEVMDFALIAHRIAEQSLLPVVIVQDARLVGQSLQVAEILPEKTVRRFLGEPDERIPCPTRSQAMLFGDERRRIPRWLSPDRPLGIGIRYREGDHLKALSSQSPFFFEHLPGIIEAEKEAFARFTGRAYPAVEMRGNTKADQLFCATGASVPQVLPVIEMLARAKKFKVGLLNIRQLVPFPGAQVSHLLTGKRVVTVIEHDMNWDGNDFPLLRSVRDSLDRATENGLHKKPPLPFPDYPAFRKVSDRPELFTAILPADHISISPAEAGALIRNMLPQGERKKIVYPGMNFIGKPTRVPTLEILQQQIKKFYPKLHRLELPALTDLPPYPRTENGAFSIRLKTFTGGVLQEAGNLFGRALSAAGFDNLYSAPNQALSTNFQAQHFTLLFARTDASLPTLHHAVDALIVDNPALLDKMSGLKENGLLILHSDVDADILWAQIPEEIRHTIQSKKLRFYILDALKVAQNVATIPGFVNELAWQALIGAYVFLEEALNERERRAIQNAYQRLITKTFGKGHFLVQEILAAFKQGGKAVQAVPYATYPGFSDIPPEPAAPWSVERVKEPDHTVFDLAHFWETEGYFVEKGQIEEVPANPMLATGVMPAGSAAFRDLTVYRTRMPAFITENCTGCGLCWTTCPEAALQGTIQTMDSLIELAMQKSRARGAGMIQIQRLLKQLTKQAYNLFGGDDLHQYPTLNALLQEAFNRLIEKLNPAEEQERVLRQEFQMLSGEVKDFPIIRTERFFNQPHRQEKGSGMVLALTINPQSCKGCGSCVAVCPDNALEALPQTADIVETYRRNWRILNELPDPEDSRLASFTSAGNSGALFHLLRKKPFHTVIGGDGSYPGSGAKRALRLIGSAVEIAMQPRYRELMDKISQLIQRLEDKIRGNVQNVFKVNDFELFSQRLSQLQGPEVSPEQLADIIREEHPLTHLDPKRLRRLSQLVTQLRKLQFLFESGAHGDGKARMTLLVNAAGVSVWGSLYPYNPFPYPAIHQKGDVAALAEGIFDAIQEQMTEVFKTVRLAELYSTDSYNPIEHDPFFANFSPDDFSEAERALCPSLLIVSDNSSLDHTTLHSIEKLLAGDRPIKVAFINTLDSAESILTEGELEHQLDIASESLGIGLWAMMQQNAYVLQTTAGTPDHFLNGISKGIALQRPAFFHIYAAEPHYHGLQTDLAAFQEKRATHCRVFPLFEYDPDKSGHFSERLSLEGNPAETEDWTTETWMVGDITGVDKPYTLEVTPADWAVKEGRYKDGFKRVSKSDWHEHMVPIIDYLKLSEEERQGKEPYIQLLDSKKQLVRIVVLPELVKFAETCQQFWKVLQELAQVQVRAEQKRLEDVQAEMQEQFEKEKQELEKSYQTQLAQLDQQHQQVYHQRLTQKLLNLYKSGKDSEMLKKTIREFLHSTNGGKG